ncbi:hypothetical protein [Streptomyces sp. NPDC051286]|uniref:hypothetical protein n=1 Tax=Streptomyces sp. NPDC051286 TaxID=3365647 RepID=UPI00378919DF
MGAVPGVQYRFRGLSSLFTQPGLVNGAVGLILAPLGRLALVLGFTVTADGITEIDVIANRGLLSQVDIAVLDA